MYEFTQNNSKKSVNYLDQLNPFSYLDNIEKNVFGNLNGNLGNFRTDIIDKGNKYILQAELPGFDKKDIKIEISDKFLTISAEHQTGAESKDQNFIRRERRYGSFSRSFDISNIEPDSISARYDNGILELELPKAAPTTEPSGKQIEIR